MLSPTHLPRKLLLLLLASTFILGNTACEHKKTAAEIQAAKVTAFRKKQKAQAIKTYTDLVTKFPDSEYAGKAHERLKALGPAPATPATAKKK
jgi:outer membrane protein assembly factor BamD (BamD/ComL family)